MAEPTFDELLAALRAVPCVAPPPNDGDDAHSSSFGGAIWDPGRLESLRYFLTRNEFEHDYRIGFTRDEAMYIVECLEELRELRAVIFNARRDAHRESEEPAQAQAGPPAAATDAPRTYTEAQLDEFDALLAAVEQRRRARVYDNLGRRRAESNRRAADARAAMLAADATAQQKGRTP